MTASNLRKLGVDPGAPSAWPGLQIRAARRVVADVVVGRERDELVHCPYCKHPDSRVVDSRTSEDGLSIRRRRQCPNCLRRFSTSETSSLTVVKRSGVNEPFSRDKVIAGVRKACQGRPVSPDDLAQLAQRVEENVRSSGQPEIDAHEVGLAILGPLRDLDVVAFLRFASVYQSFDSLDDFDAAIGTLRSESGSGFERQVGRSGVPTV